MIGASGWLAFYLELPKPAGEGDAAIVRALSRALTATLKLLDPPALPRDIFGVHRPVTVTISQFCLEHAVWVEPPPGEHGLWPDRNHPLEPHERATGALGILLQDLRNDAAWSTLWHEIIEVLRWSRYGEPDQR